MVDELVIAIDLIARDNGQSLPNEDLWLVALSGLLPGLPEEADLQCFRSVSAPSGPVAASGREGAGDQI
jgi:hypothetical protein